jgi:hypothetical protein
MIQAEVLWSVVRMETNKMLVIALVAAGHRPIRMSIIQDLARGYCPC